MKNLLLILAFLLSTLSFSQNLRKEILDLTKNKNATVAVSVSDFNSSFTVHINADKRLPMQSVFKLHIAMAVLDQIDHGKLSLNQNVFIPRKDLLQNTHSPLRDDYSNSDINIMLSELIKYTVSQSDNNGADILLRRIGGPLTVQKYIDSLKVKDFAIKYNEEQMHKITDLQYQNYTTTKSLNRVLKLIWEGKALSKTSTDFLMKTLVETSTGKNRLIAQLTKNTVVAHKTGTSFTENGLTAATNDAGVVTLPNRKKYAISVLVSDSKENETTNEKIIADISKKVWDYFNSKK